MRKFYVTTILLSLTIGFLFIGHTGCKKSTDVKDISLTVNLSLGAKGTPSGGTYIFDAESQVDYAYELKDRYTDLKVILDGTEIAASGTISITGTHILDITATPIPGDYLLSVTVASGVSGTPETGNFYYNQTEELPYSYSLDEGYTNLRVQLDGETIPNSGILTFQRAHTLNVFSDKYYEIRGTWTMEEKYSDGSQFTVTLTFSGTGTSGTVTDSDGGHGTYTTSGPSLNFALEYPDVTYSYDGTFSDESSISGYSNRTISTDTYTGTWTATLNTTSTSSLHSIAGKRAGKGN